MKKHVSTKPKTQAAASSHVLQRKCACGNSTTRAGECEGCARNSGSLQRKPANHSVPGEVPPVVHEVLRSGTGRPLDPATRASMEPRFGHDFSRVRVHTDAKAAESARAVDARAYTVGRDVVFDAGQYAPRTPAGQGLLAHELTHVVQQRSAAHALPGEIEVAPASDALETDARASETAPVQPIGSAGAVRVQRQVAATARPDESAELDQDFARIVAILNESHYSDRDEAEVITILRRWAWRSEPAVLSGRGRNPLDELFARLTMKTTTIGVVVGELTSYYSLIFNHFDRVGEVREIRDRYSQRFQGDEGIAEVSLGEQLKEGGWKRTAEEFWSEKFKGMGEYLNQIGTPTLVQNLLGGVVGVLQGFAEIVVELAEGVLSLVQALDHVQGAVLHVLTGAAEELGLGFLKRIPLVGRVFDPETYRARYEATAGFLSGARAALQDPGQIWAGIKDAASKAWDEVMTEYQAADEFNKSRIIARGVVKVGMAIGGAIKDLPRLASSAAKFATTVGRAAVKAVRTLAQALRGGFRVLGKVVRGTWKVLEETLENGSKRLRYYFKRQGATAADEVAEADAAAYIRCSTCQITPQGKVLDAAADLPEESFARVLDEAVVPPKPAPLKPPETVSKKWPKTDPEFEANMAKARLQKGLDNLGDMPDLQAEVAANPIRMGDGVTTLRDVAADSPAMLKQLWREWQAGVAKGDIKTKDFGAYIKGRMQREFRGGYGEMTEAFKVGPDELMVQAPGKVTAAGLDTVTYRSSTDRIRLLDNKAIKEGRTVGKVTALEENLVKNVGDLVDEVEVAAKGLNVPPELSSKVLPRLKAAHADLQAYLQANPGADLRSLQVQKDFAAILNKHGIDRAVTFSGAGAGAGMTSTLGQKGFK